MSKMLVCISFFRDARWMTPERALGYRNVILAVLFLAIVVSIATARHGINVSGIPIGADFISFWTASHIALSGVPQNAYDTSLHWTAQKAVFNDPNLHYMAFFYPPVFLLICLPLAVLPYFCSLACWLGVTLYACWRTIRNLAGRADLTWSILAFPAVFVNAMHGQNGFLSTALFAGAALTLERRPAIAGLLFGCLIYKPHLLMMVPFALIAGRRWTTAATAVGTAMVLCLVSLAIFGADTWRAFLSDTTLARVTLEQGLVGDAKMQSVFAAVRLFGGTVGSAYRAQMATALAAALLLIYLCRRIPMREGAGAALVAATLLATPFLLAYDLMLLAVPLAWVMRASYRTGFLPWEKLALMAAFAMPLLSTIAALHLMVPIAPLVIIGLYAAVARRLLLFCRTQ